MDRSAHVEVRPRDHFRFVSAVARRPDGDPAAVARITPMANPSSGVFTDISFPEHIDDAQLAATISDEGFTKHVRDTTTGASADAEVGWEARDLPDGFRLSATDNEDEQANGEHLVYSDGLTSVSVFIESLRDSKPMHGYRMVGGSSAFSTMVNGFQVTVVGEVPEPTARMIGDSMRPLALTGEK